MKSTDYHELQIGDFCFRPVLALGPVDGANDEGPIVRYRVLDKEFLCQQRGVYVIRVSGEVVYCGKYTTTFSKRWLYARDGYVYHFKRMAIALAIAEGLEVTVFAETETTLRRQLSKPTEVIDAIEDSIIRQFRPPWNRGTQQGSVTHFVLAEPPALCFKLRKGIRTLRNH